jgi:hypothetical protein
MRQWIRSHLTYANVMVTILAFIVLGGGTAAAAFVVSSNSQIGPDTIYGHNAPSGANKNVVTNSLTGADVKESSLGQVPNAANGARRIDYNHAATDASPVTVLKLDEMTLSARCYLDGPQTVLHLFATSAVSADINFGYLARIGAGTTDPVADGLGLTPGSQTLWLAIPGFDVFTRTEGQLVYHNPKRVISVTFHAVANDSNERCQVTGTALPAPN